MNENLPRIRSSIIVGIGGTGALAALYAKRSLIQFYGEVPKVVKFLVLDTDNRRPYPTKVNLKGSQWKKVGIDDHEFLYLSVDQPLKVIELSPSIRKWWPEGIPTKSILNGGGGYRARGRLAFHAHADRIQGIIQRAVNDILSMDSAHRMLQEQKLSAIEGAVEVYVVASLAGGTGSGAFTDAGFCLRKALEGVRHRVVGFFITPSIFEGLPATPRVKINGYAALKEIEHYLNLDYLKEKPRFVFGKDEFAPDLPPYDVVNLVESVQENGQVIPGKGTERGVMNLGRILGEGIALNVGNIGARAESACDNLHGLIAAQTSQDWGGKRPHFSTVGLSSIIYPMEKHFNQLSAYYAYGLIDGLLGLVRGGLDEEREREIEKDIGEFMTENELMKDQLFQGLLSSESLRHSLSAEGLSSTGDLEQEVELGRRKRNTLKEQLEDSHAVGAKRHKERIRGYFKNREESKGIIYARKACEKMAARFNVFRDEILEEVRQLEGELPVYDKGSKEFFEDRVRGVGLTDRLLRKRESIYQDYLGRAGKVFEMELDIDRRRKALALIGEMVKLLKEYLESLGLGAVEVQLSEVRRSIEEDYFGSSQLLDEYGQCSLILYPREIFVEKSGAPGTVIPVSRGMELIDLPSDFEKLNIPPPDPKDLLSAIQLTLQDIERADVDAIKKKIMGYVRDQLEPITRLGIEKILPLREEGILYWLREAARRASPLWHHNAMAEMKAMMDEIFIVGVGDEYRTAIKEVSFSDSQYPPTFMSTMDDHKIFLFKFKAPLPAYLLMDMERYRQLYLDTPVELTPHAENKIELVLPDLFPETELHRRTFRVALLAVMAGLIKEDRINRRFVLDDPRFLRAGESSVELGWPGWQVMEQLGKPQNKVLLESLADFFAQEVRSNPSALKDALISYHGSVKQAFEKRDGSMCLGDVILLFKQMCFLDALQRSGGDVGNLLG